MKAYAIICLSRADDTFQPDGRCDYRKCGSNPPKRSLSFKSRKRENGVIRSTHTGLNLYRGMWQAQIIRDRLQVFGQPKAYLKVGGESC